MASEERSLDVDMEYELNYRNSNVNEVEVSKAGSEERLFFIAQNGQNEKRKLCWK